MERRLAKKFDTHIVSFKDQIKEWFVEKNCQIEGNANTSDFLKFIYDFDGIALSKEDFLKRKRVKSVVPQYERCTAKRANGDQCTRRRKDTECFCGTHSKGTPHGVIDTSGQEEKNELTKVEVWVQEIKGINYYIDITGNVYKVEDVIANKNNPAIIAQYKVNQDGVYTIPEFNI
jgi:hypothetical protein